MKAYTLIQNKLVRIYHELEEVCKLSSLLEDFEYSLILDTWVSLILGNIENLIEIYGKGRSVEDGVVNKIIKRCNSIIKATEILALQKGEGDVGG